MRGLCECGCGQPAPIAPQTKVSSGDIKGQPMRYIRGHNRRLWGRGYMVDEATGCWIWNGQPNSGYGSYRLRYERERGPIPDGLELDHLCRASIPSV